VAGATGVLGRELVPRLVARGHEVVGMTRTASRRGGLRVLGARPVVADALDPGAVAKPAPVREWLPALASALGAKPPRRMPRWLGRLAAGEMATLMMTEVRGASNAKAKRELGWRLRYPSWRLGFAQGLG
jgi:nucleoside-diphosphate-sugar epimerase